MSKELGFLVLFIFSAAACADVDLSKPPQAPAKAVEVPLPPPPPPPPPPVYTLPNAVEISMSASFVQDQTICAGGSVVLTGNVSGGSNPKSYQWLSNSNVIPGATGISISVDAGQFSGPYSLRVINPAGEKLSDPIPLFQMQPPTISQGPIARSVIEGQPTNFSVIANGATSFQWRKNGLYIVGATANTLNLGSVGVADASPYDVIVSNACGSVISNAAALTVFTLPSSVDISVSANFISQTQVCRGESIQLTGTVSGGSDPKTYQWLANGIVIPGATGLSYTVDPAEFPGPYKLVVTNPAGTIESVTKPGSILSEEVLTIQPSSAHGANVVILLDDSGSMTDKIQRVVTELRSFILQLTASTSDNYRLILIYDYTKQAFAGEQFRDSNGQVISDPNPFAPQIDNQKVFYFRQETFSTWADVALFKTFAFSDFSQVLPIPIPLDQPSSGAPKTFDSCLGAGSPLPGKWFRPRFGSNQFSISSCIVSTRLRSDMSSPRAFDKLLPNTAINVMAVSDDDLSVNFNRSNFSLTDPNKNAFPEISWNMMQQVLLPPSIDPSTNPPVVYHSVVGLNAADKSANRIADIGTAHLALSKHSGGGVFDILSTDYGQIFNSLHRRIVFSDQALDLKCAPVLGQSIEVRFNRGDGSGFVTVDPSLYSLDSTNRRVTFNANAFQNSDEGRTIQVQIRYLNTGGSQIVSP